MVRISNERSGAGAKGRSERAARKFVAKRREILRAAAAAFRERGFQATGMRDIADKAGLSAANLYYYFPSKDHLLFFCQDQALDRMLAACEEARRSEPTAPERLRRVIQAHLACMLDELDASAAHVAVDALAPDLRRKIVAKRDRYERAVRSLVAEGVEAGELRACEPVLVTRAILGALNWTAQWFRPEGGTPSGRVAAEYTDYLVRGLLP